MSPTAVLFGADLRTYEMIFQRPPPRILGWNDIHSLLRRAANVAAESNGNLRVTRNGQTLILPPCRSRFLTNMDQIRSLRHFFEKSEGAMDEGLDEVHWLLVFHEDRACIYLTELHEGIPERLLAQHPLDYCFVNPPANSGPRELSRSEADISFEPVATELRAAGPILLLGTGVAKVCRMYEFISWAQAHDTSLAKRFLGSFVVPASALDEGLLEKVREFYAGSGKAIGEDRFPVAERRQSNAR